MAYQWTRRDIGVVRRILREQGGDKVTATAELLEIVPTLDREEIAIAIEIAEQEKEYEKGELSLEKLLENEARLGIDLKKASRYDYI